MTTTLENHTPHTVRFVPGYVGTDLLRRLRAVPALVFTIGLPAALYIMFGVLQDWSDVGLGRGNVSAYLMVAMAVYGAIEATTTTAGEAAVERASGWNRQLALTPYGDGSYVLGKVVVALAVSAVATGAVFAVGAVTSARADGWVWLACGLLVLVGAAEFTLYGLAFGLWFRSEGAVSAASGLIVVLCFLGNAFTPLSGSLVTFSRFTPVYGVAALARYPLTEGSIVTSTSVVEDPLWYAVLNMAAWTVIFALAVAIGLRRSTRRA